MGALLLLSLLLFSAAGFAEAGNHSSPTAPAGSASVVASPFAGMPQGLSLLDHASRDNGADNVCLNIHAFTFKTNDDRVPELVGETTCMPASQAGAKKANEKLQPKLIPATGGETF